MYSQYLADWIHTIPTIDITTNTYTLEQKLPDTHVLKWDACVPEVYELGSNNATDLEYFTINAL